MKWLVHGKYLAGCCLAVLAVGILLFYERPVTECMNQAAPLWKHNQPVSCGAAALEWVACVTTCSLIIGLYYAFRHIPYGKYPKLFTGLIALGLIATHITFLLEVVVDIFLMGHKS